MRKIIFFLAMLLYVTVASANNIVTISSAKGAPGEEVTLTVSLTNSDLVTGAQLAIPLDEMLTFVPGSLELADGRSNGHRISSTQRGNSLTIMVYSLANKELRGNEGELLRFKLRLGQLPRVCQLRAAVTLGGTAGTSLDCTSLTGLVTIVSPYLQVPSHMDYGRCAIRSDYTQTISIDNTGTAPLTIRSASISSDEFSVAEELPITVGVGQHYDFTVRFSPKKHGKVQATLALISNATNSEQTVSLLAEAYSVNELSLGEYSGSTGDVVDVSLHVSNMETLTGLQCEIQLPEAVEYVSGSFALNNDRCPGLYATSTYDGNKLTLIAYSFGTPKIEEGEGEIGTFKLKLKGPSGTYSLTPQNVALGNNNAENMTSAVHSGSITVFSPTMDCPAEVHLGEKRLGDPWEDGFMVQNTGNTSLHLTQAIVIGEGCRVTTEFPIEVGAGESAFITIEGEATSAGENSVTINIYNDDPDILLHKTCIEWSVMEINTLSLSGHAENDNTRCNLVVSMDNQSKILSAQMDLHLPDVLSFSAEDITLSDRCDRHYVSCKQIAENTYRLLVFTLNNAPISGEDGDVFTASFHVTGVLENTGTQVVIDNIVLGDASASNKLTSQSELSYEFARRCLVHIESSDISKGNVEISGADEGYVDYGQTIDMLVIPEEECELCGLYEADRLVEDCRTGYVSEWSITVEKDIDYIALFLHSPHSVTYLIDGQEIAKRYVEEQQDFPIVDVPVKEGYQFSGWSITQNGEDYEFNGSYIPVGVSVPDETICLYPGSKRKLTAYVAGTTDEFTQIVWTSDNPIVARVDAEGIVSALLAGEATITGSVPGTDISVSIVVTVEAGEVDLPTPFEFNYNAKDYDPVNHRIPNDEHAILGGYNLQFALKVPNASGAELGYPIFENEYLSFHNSYTSIAYIDKWACNGDVDVNLSQKYFGYNSVPDLTIVFKSTGRSELLYATGYRLSSNGSIYDFSYGTYFNGDYGPTDPQIHAVRFKSDGTIDFMNLSKGTKESYFNPNALTCFGNEPFFLFASKYLSNHFEDDFYWMYYAHEYLSDDDIAKVVYHNDGPVEIRLEKGDVNADGYVDIRDVSTLIDIVLGKNEDKYGMADVNDDYTISIQDVVTLVELIKNKISSED